MVNTLTDTSKINRSELARATGVDVAHISRILNGQRQPSLALAVKIADYLGISLDRLTSLLKQ